MARNKNALYRNAYAIGLYALMDETLITLVDNAEQLSRYLNITRRATDVLLCNVFNKKQKCVRVGRQQFEINFIKIV